MESQMGYHEARAALEWLLELGAVDAVGDSPVDRYALPQAAPGKKAKPEATAQAAPAPTPNAGPPQTQVDVVGEARRAAAGAGDLAALKAAMAAYPHCELRKGARQLVFGEGQAGARLMIVGDAPGRDEDQQGRPFVGRQGQLLDRMLAAIDMGRDMPDAPVYLTHVLPWRPPQNRDPKPDEIAMITPFLERHVALVNPDVIILMGNTACEAALGKRGVQRLRGQWGEAFGKPVLPMCHPEYLMRTPSAKRDAWADLLSVKAKLGALA
ncbi:uracil-DNA glycosylase [Rhodobacteraceae bacterium D3-12]|nr:uracil-DNA glycosylase [Rhodobacteraceae bacterium D3-12]